MKTFLSIAIPLALILGFDIWGTLYTGDTCRALETAQQALYAAAEGEDWEAADRAYASLSQTWRDARFPMNVLFDHVHVGDVDDILAQMQAMLAHRDTDRLLPMIQLLGQHLSEFPEKLRFSPANIL